jgi:hypothetical protein
MSKRYESKKFKDLRNKWYAKLNKEGFEDIEINRTDGSSFEYPALRNPGYKWETFEKKYNVHIFNHFRACRNFLSHAQFASTFDKQVWQMYTEGVSIRKIAQHFCQNGQQLSAFPIFRKIKELKIQMLLFNKYDPEGLEYEASEESDNGR